METRIYNFDLSIITDEMVKEYAKETGFCYATAKMALIEALDEEYAPYQE